MQTTLRDLSVPTVSEATKCRVRAWLAARLAWEDRLDELEHVVGPVIDGAHRHGGAAA